MSKIQINGSIKSEHLSLGDNNTVYIYTDNFKYKLLGEIHAINKVIEENNTQLKDIAFALEEAIKANDSSKFMYILKESKNFLLQFAANFSAICLDHLTHL